MATKPIEKETLSIREAAEMLGISRGTTYKLASEGNLPGVLRLGKKTIRVSRKVLERFCQN